VADCIACPSGTITTAVGNTDSRCSACPPGTFQQAGVCASCAGGTYSSPGATACAVCAGGSYSLANATACTQCGAGSFSGQAGSTRCTDCLPGYYTDFVGYTACRACTPGSISSVNGSGACSSCGAGKYAGTGSSAVSESFFWWEVGLFGLKPGVLAVLAVPRRELVGPRGGFGRGMHGLRQGQVLGLRRGDPRERLLELLGRDVRGEQPVDAGENRSRRVREGKTRGSKGPSRRKLGFEGS
jgi:hypothetical protein